MASVSARICFSSTLRARFIGRLDLGADVGDTHDDQPGLAVVEGLAELLEIVPAQAGRRVPGQRAEHGAAPGTHDRGGADGGEREQRDDEARREADTGAEHAADAVGVSCFFVIFTLWPPSWTITAAS